MFKRGTFTNIEVSPSIGSSIRKKNLLNKFYELAIVAICIAHGYTQFFVNGSSNVLLLYTGIYNVENGSSVNNCIDGSTVTFNIEPNEGKSIICWNLNGHDERKTVVDERDLRVIGVVGISCPVSLYYIL